MTDAAKQAAEALRRAQKWLQPLVHVTNAQKCVAEALAALEAEAAQAIVPDRETSWLIERPGPVYIAQLGQGGDWTIDPWRAQRFQSEKAAWDRRLMIAVDEWRDASRPVEHVFINKPYSEAATAALRLPTAQEREELARRLIGISTMIGLEWDGDYRQLVFDTLRAAAAIVRLPAAADSPVRDAEAATSGADGQGSAIARTGSATLPTGATLPAAADAREMQEQEQER